MPRSMRKGLYRVIYLVKGRRAAVPATLQFDAAMRELAALKRRGFTAWIESDSGEFVPVEGAMRKPKEIVDEQRRHRVADFSSLPELIEHAKSVDGASHLLISGRHTKIYFPRQDGRYDEGSVWQQHGYWHAPAPSDRVVVTGLPAGAEPIGSHVQRVGRRAGEARLSETSRRRGAKSALELAGELSRQLNGSKPRIIPGGFRWNEQNEAAQFTTHSPEYGQKVVVVIATFPDRSVAVDYFGDEGLSETARYENVGHNTYKSTADLPEMVNDIRWVWETVDRYAASWQNDEEDNHLEEVRPRRHGRWESSRPHFDRFRQHIAPGLKAPTRAPRNHSTGQFNPLVRDYIAVDPRGRPVAGPFTDYDKAKREADRARGYVKFASPHKTREAQGHRRFPRRPR